MKSSAKCITLMLFVNCAIITMETENKQTVFPKVKKAFIETGIAKKAMARKLRTKQTKAIINAKQEKKTFIKKALLLALVLNASFVGADHQYEDDEEFLLPDSPGGGTLRLGVDQPIFKASAPLMSLKNTTSTVTSWNHYSGAPAIEPTNVSCDNGLYLEESNTWKNNSFCKQNIKSIQKKPGIWLAAIKNICISRFYTKHFSRIYSWTDDTPEVIHLETPNRYIPERIKDVLAKDRLYIPINSNTECSYKDILEKIGKFLKLEDTTFRSHELYYRDKDNCYLKLNHDDCDIPTILTDSTPCDPIGILFNPWTY